MRVVSEPGFAAESEELIRLAGGSEPIESYEALVEARSGQADPALAGEADPEVETADLYLPLSGGPTLVRVYRGGPGPLVLWLHGGAFIGGSLRDIVYATSRIARLSGSTVVSLEYRLAPEHPYPAGLDDTYDALCWLATHGSVFGGDGTLVAGGQSAGAALVAGACLMARDRGGPRVDRQVLCYPSLDFGQQTESFKLYAGILQDDRQDAWADAGYLAGQEPTSYAAPLRAESLDGLPPALVIGAGRDPLRDDARAYAARLENADYVEYANTVHAFLNFCGLLSAGRHAVGLVADTLRTKHSTV